MTDLTPEQKIAQVLDDYRKVCFLVKDYGLDNDKSVHLLALATISAKDDLHLDLLELFLPPELWQELERLNKADFFRWCA